MFEQTVLDHLVLGYSPIVDRQRAVVATRLAVFPERPDAVPDVVDEALWTLDLFRRMQRDDGGVGEEDEEGSERRKRRGTRPRLSLRSVSDHTLVAASSCCSPTKGEVKRTSGALVLSKVSFN